MKKLSETRIKILIMTLPALLLAIVFMLILGESFMPFAVLFAIYLCVTVNLADKLSKKDAISYSLVQYPFMLLLYALFVTVSPGFAFILTFPITYVVNMSIGYLYFRFVKKKSWYTKVLVFALTVLITIALYPELDIF